MGGPALGHAFIGTSGWSYEHWQDSFYPRDLPKKDRFAYYTEHMPTVELNATFYHLFPEKTFQGWADKAPKGFIYAVKMWRRITHYKRLKQVDDDMLTFLTRAMLLDDHLGPVLIQLPPGLHRDDDLLKRFLSSLSEIQKSLHKKLRAAIEFRHASWFDEEVYRILENANAGLCLADMPKVQNPRRVTSDFSYVRFHGRPHLYQSLYSEEELAEWGGWLGEQLDAGRDAFVYFNNDFNAHAVLNARQLRDMLGARQPCA
jgi:uncharacterized protein YecE (DUF72 family)